MDKRSGPRVGLFGILGAGNSGNDASLETVLAYLREAHPDAVLDALCGGPERVQASYGIDATPLFWYQKYENRVSGLTAGVLKAAGKGIDVARTISWVRGHDAVIVPGAGALEATLPMRAWQFPFALFTLASSGKLFGTKVALVSVGADTISSRAMRWLSNSTARLVSYRSYRDTYSRDAMRQRGIDTAGDSVYPDLVFGVPTPPYDPGDPQLVGVGVMAYYGGPDDRPQADQIHAAYVGKMTRFTGWLVDTGRDVRLFGGDSKFDVAVAEQIAAEVRSSRPDLDPPRITVEPLSSYQELLRRMAPVGLVVATRYHNVMGALKLCKPTIALGYSRKFLPLMGDMGLAEFNQFAHSLDVDRLIEQFTELESRRTELTQLMAERNETNQRSLDHQFAVLSDLLFPVGRPVSAEADGDLAPGLPSSRQPA
jgi:polysaccharide pyruvyl transferase WcaK-like protein